MAPPPPIRTVGAPHLASYMFRQPKPEPMTYFQLLLPGLLTIVFAFEVFLLADIFRLYSSKTTAGYSDFAALANGARIIHACTSNSFQTIVEQSGRSGNDDDPAPQDALTSFTESFTLWCLNGTQGTLAVELASPALVNRVTLDGYPAGSSSAPREVALWGLVSSSNYAKLEGGPDSNAKAFPWPASLPPQLFRPVHVSEPLPLSIRVRDLFTALSARKPIRTLRWTFLGSLEYDQHSDTHASHDFYIPRPLLVVPMYAVAIEFQRNWGASFTCSAGFRVSGSAWSRG